MGETNIQLLCSQLGMNIAQLAKALGVPLAKLRDWEAGRSAPSGKESAVLQQLKWRARHTIAKRKPGAAVPAPATLSQERGKVSREVVQVRQFLKLDRKAFAKKLGVSENQVRRWECGHAKPSPEEKKAIRILLGMPMAK